MDEDTSATGTIQIKPFARNDFLKVTGSTAVKVTPMKQGSPVFQTEASTSAKVGVNKKEELTSYEKIFGKQPDPSTTTRSTR